MLPLMQRRIASPALPWRGEGPESVRNTAGTIARYARDTAILVRRSGSRLCGEGKTGQGGGAVAFTGTKRR